MTPNAVNMLVFSLHKKAQPIVKSHHIYSAEVTKGLEMALLSIFDKNIINGVNFQNLGIMNETSSSFDMPVASQLK